MWLQRLPCHPALFFPIPAFFPAPFPTRAFPFQLDIHSMKKQILQAVAAAVLLGAIPMAALAQNAAIVNGKPVPKARMDVLA